MFSWLLTISVIGSSVTLGEFSSRFLKNSFHFYILSFWLAALNFAIKVIIHLFTSFTVCHAIPDCLSSTELLILLIRPWMATLHNTVVCGNCWLTVLMTASWLDIKKNSVWKIISEDLAIWKVSAKLVPGLLNDYQKRCIQVRQDIIECLPTEPDLLCSHRWWWGMNFWVWPRNQVPEQSVELSDVPETKESETVQVKSQSQVNPVLWYEGGIVHRSSCHWASLLGDPAAYALLSKWKEMSFGETNCGCFTTTMHLPTMPWTSRSFWPKGASLYLPFHLILFCVTFFFSLSSRGSSR